MISIIHSVENVCLLSCIKVRKYTKPSSILYAIKNQNYSFQFLTVYCLVPNAQLLFTFCLLKSGHRDNFHFTIPKFLLNAFAGLVDFGTLIQLSKQTFSTLSEIEIISFIFLQCIAQCLLPSYFLLFVFQGGGQKTRPKSHKTLIPD